MALAKLVRNESDRPSSGRRPRTCCASGHGCSLTDRSRCAGPSRVNRYAGRAAVAGRGHPADRFTSERGQRQHNWPSQKRSFVRRRMDYIGRWRSETDCQPASVTIVRWQQTVRYLVPLSRRNFCAAQPERNGRGVAPVRAVSQISGSMSSVPSRRSKRRSTGRCLRFRLLWTTLAVVPG